MSLADQVRKLEAKYTKVSDIAGEIICTLIINQQHFFNDEVKAKAFAEMVQKWEARFKEVASG